MIVPQTDAEEEAVPLFDDLLQRFGPLLSNDSEDGSWEGWQPDEVLEITAE
jgi:hypothetical protein